MLKKIMFTVFSVLFVLIMFRTSYSKEVLNKVSFNNGRPGVSFVFNSAAKNNQVLFDGHRRHRGPLYFYYTEPLHFRNWGHRHRERERHDRHERHEHHEKHHGKHRH